MYRYKKNRSVIFAMVNRQSSSSTSTSSRSSQSSSYEEESSDAAMEIGKYWSTEAILARAIPNTAVVSAPPDASMLYEPRKLFTPYVSLGPVIGMVTESVARILVEVSVHSSVKCFLTDKFGVQHGREMKCPREKPVVFEFRELRQGTYYKVSFDIPVPGVVKSGFKTLNKNWSMAKHPARIAAVSSNNFHHRGRCVELDLWKHLYESCRKSEIDYLLHLGNVVFVDNPSSDSFNAYQEATEYCKESMSENSKIEPVVCEIFRNVYRDAWCHYTTRHVLANVPNLMTLGEHEIRQHSAEDSEAKLSFVDRCAYAVYNEYCRSLFENLPHSTKGYSTSSVSDSMRINQSYHFHAFGNLGILFLDTLAQSAFHHRSVEDLSTHHSLPFLGTKQWSDIQFALSPSGYLDNCKALLVCTSTPIAHTGVPGLMGIKNIEGTWNARENISEASLILEKLFEWKAAKHGRRNIA